MLGMLSLVILAFSLFPASNALSISPLLDSGPASNDMTTDYQGPVSKIHIVNKVIGPDGFNRSATLANGVFPGPLIQANKGDHFAVQVFNELTDESMYLETSIHWHGIFQYRSNWADGVSYITQCPLRPDEAFTHRSTPTGQTGTYWYHSHHRTQYCDGLRGPLVIYDSNDPASDLYDFDNSTTVITLGDWYHNSSIVVAERGHIRANSTLINGLGRYAGGPPSPLAVVNVQEKSRYRFRLVSLACDPAFNFSIDGHRMTIIEVEGTAVYPEHVDWIQIHPGQRYSVIVTANQTVGNYWIRALPDYPNATFNGGLNKAILRYNNAPVEDPVSPPGPYELAYNERDLHPRFNARVPGVPEIGKADINIKLAPGISDGHFTINNVSFVSPSVPFSVLLQILGGARNATDLLPKGSVYPLGRNKVVEISFPDPTATPGGPHPMHLHGHNFYVIRSAGSDEYNFVNPVRRDVVSIGNSSTDNVTIRFVTDNPGPWFLHCHIDWHLNNGFAVVMAEAPLDAAVEEAEVIPAEWGRLCPEGQAWGQVALGNRVLHP